MRELVSILIPAYNAEKYISATIESALAQTWKNKEIIVVDDGSYDRTYEVAKGFESGSLKVVKQENRGASAARNKAFSFAQGDYIQWLDADDLLAPEKIERQMRIAKEESELTLLSCSFGVFYANPRRAIFTPTVLWADLNPIDWLCRKFEKNLWMNPAVWLVSRKLTEKAGPWDERLSLDDDGEYFARVVAASEQVRFVADARSYYRQWSHRSLSRAASKEACESLFLSLSLCIRYLLALEDSERTRQASCTLLQNWITYFYPEKGELLCKANDLADRLGGRLRPPKLGWKYKPVEWALGWSSAKKARACVAATKLLWRIRLEELQTLLERGIRQEKRDRRK